MMFKDCEGCSHKRDLLRSNGGKISFCGVHGDYCGISFVSKARCGGRDWAKKAEFGKIEEKTKVHEEKIKVKSEKQIVEGGLF